MLKFEILKELLFILNESLLLPQMNETTPIDVNMLHVGLWNTRIGIDCV